MSARQLVAAVRDAGASIETSGDRLKLKSDRGPLPDDLVEALRCHKAEVIDLLVTERASRVASQWGDLAPIVEWFLTADPPTEPFKLKQGITITNPARWWHDIAADIAAGPEGPRARYGVLQDDVIRAWQMFGPQAISAGNA